MLRWIGFDRAALLVDKDEVLASIGDGSVSIIDALPEAHYRGEMSMRAVARTGRLSQID